MDTLTGSMLASFSKEYELDHLPEDKRFEHFCGFATTRRHYKRTFDPTEITTGDGDDTGIDSIAILVNNVLVTDVDTVNELADQNGYIEASFLLCQADRGTSFSSAKIGNFSFGVQDFFATEAKLPRNQKIKDAAEIMSAIYERSSIFRERPNCTLYYVTTGSWKNEVALVGRRDGAIQEISDLQIFNNVQFNCLGAEEIQTAYTQTRNPIARDFIFSRRLDVPPAPGVNQAFIGYIPFSAFKTIVSDDSGEEILGSIFNDNVRDWQEYAGPNNDIRDTLVSSAKARFVLMNNGITIIARSIKNTNERFTIEDFQIVNGCQTSHVVFYEREALDDLVNIPLRLIETRDEDVIESIVYATNNQTPLKPEQLLALLRFSRKLEKFFQTYDGGRALYYERRDGQYDRMQAEKTRIATPADVIRSFASMFLAEPHRTTRSYKALRDKIGDEIFNDDHKLEPYYAAAYALYRLDFLFRNYRLPAKYKPARYHILLATRLALNPLPLPPMNSAKIADRANELINVLWSPESDELFVKACAIVEEVAGGNLNRDWIRRQPITDAILKQFGQYPKPAE